jgi:hypothetical protein
VLTAIAQQGDAGAERDQLTILTGYKRSTRNAYIQRLQSRGYVNVEGDRITVTDAGEDALGDYERLPTGEALQAFWLGRLPEGERACCRRSSKRIRSAVDRESADRRHRLQAVDAQRVSAAARRAALVESDGSGVRASATLFDGGSY